MDLPRALLFFPSKPADRSRNDAAAAVALVVAWWLDDEEAFRAVRIGDMRTTDTLEAYVREHAEQAQATKRGRRSMDLIAQRLAAEELELDFARIREGRQAEHYDNPNRDALVTQRARLLARVREIEQRLR